MGSQVFNYNGNNITFQLGNGDIMINATEMAKPFGKRPNDYLGLPSTKNFIEAVTRKNGIANYQVVTAIRGGNLQGTFLHEDIALDSVYVVAYYTIQIPFAGGPESFTGLPGTILGLAMPHENMTWFATKVTEIPVSDKDLAPPIKGKPTDNKGLNKILLDALKDWGKWARKTLQAYSL